MERDGDMEQDGDDTLEVRRGALRDVLHRYNNLAGALLTCVEVARSTDDAERRDRMLARAEETALEMGRYGRQVRVDLLA